MTQAERIQHLQRAAATINARQDDLRVPSRGEWERMSRLILQLAGRPDLNVVVDNVVALRRP